MNEEEQQQFRKDFQSIVWMKGEVTSNNQKLTQLEYWNKLGSHDDAILRCLDEGDNIKAMLKDKLKGKKYEEWLQFSKKLSSVKARHKRALEQLEKAGTELTNLKFL